MQPCVIFDCDGVLLYKGHPTPLLEFAKQLGVHWELATIVVSGRRPGEWGHTWAQLGKFGLHPTESYCVGREKKLGIIKILATRFNILTVFEDDPRDVDALREADIPYTAVHSGLYDWEGMKAAAFVASP